MGINFRKILLNNINQKRYNQVFFSQVKQSTSILIASLILVIFLTFIEFYLSKSYYILPFLATQFSICVYLIHYIYKNDYYENDLQEYTLNSSINIKLNKESEKYIKYREHFMPFTLALFILSIITIIIFYYSLNEQYKNNKKNNSFFLKRIGYILPTLLFFLIVFPIVIFIITWAPVQEPEN